MIARQVLIVEDEMIVQLHLEQIIEAIGHTVVATASTATEAVEAAARHDPDLLLMDIQLGDGSDGVEAALTIRESSECALIFITANADDATVARTERAGASGYVVKPFSAAGVRAAVATALAGHDRLLELQQRERSLQAALVRLGDAVFVTDEAGAISFANPRSAELIGWPLHEFYGKKLMDVLRFAVDSDRALLSEAVEGEAADASRSSFRRMELLSSDGRERKVRIDVESLDANAGAPGRIVMLRDLEARAAARNVSRGPKQKFGPGARVLVYSHDTFGLGHLQRSLNLISALVKRHPGISVLLVTGSPLVHRYAMPEGVDYVKLPAVRKVADEEYEARSLSMPDEGILRFRSNLLMRSVKDYDPDVLLVDHSPTGMKDELLPAIDWLRTEGRCVTLLGLRDIVDAPEFVVPRWRERGVYEVLRDRYDHIVVYGSAEFFDPVREYEFSTALSEKTHFVHHVCRESIDAVEEEDPKGSEAQVKPLVVVSIGGGDGGEEVIGTFIEMLRRYPSDFQFRAEILTGAFLPADQLEHFRASTRDLPVTLRDFIPSTTKLIREAVLVISTAGYNTTTDLLAYANRAILIPRVLHRQEQSIRAKGLAELGLVTHIRPDDATPETLRDAVKAALEGPEVLARSREQGRLKLDGAACFAEFCGGLLIGSRSEPGGG